MQLGDRLLAVGDASTEQSTLDEVMNLTRVAKDPVRLVVQHLGSAQWHAVQVFAIGGSKDSLVAKKFLPFILQKARGAELARQLQARQAKAMEATAPGTERVLLRKNGGGLGIRIRGGADTRHVAVYIEAVVPNLPAAQSGKIVAGDTLVAVNGVNLQGASHATVIRLLQESPEETVLEVCA